MALPTGVEYSTQELLAAQSHIWNHIFNHINSLSLKCAIQLGIPDAIHKHGEPMTLSQLADALPVAASKSDGLRRLMRILTHSKFFVKVKICKDKDKDEDEDEDEEEEAYTLTTASRLLTRDEPLSIGPFALAILDQTGVDPFQHMGEWFRNEEVPTPFFSAHGKNIFEHAGEEQGWNRLFNEGMASDARLVATVLGRDCREVFEGLETMVDVGGGTGTVAKWIAGAFPGVKCTVLELPHVVAGLEGAENLSFVGGDMFESIPHADAVFLKWIYHDWSDDECIKLLQKCKDAVKNNGGKVIIVDMVVDDKKQDYEATQTQLCFDMLMMTLATGKERTEKEWATLFLAAGFTRYKITPVLGLRSLIEVFL